MSSSSLYHVNTVDVIVVRIIQLVCRNNIVWWMENIWINNQDGVCCGERKKFFRLGLVCPRTHITIHSSNTDSLFEMIKKKRFSYVVDSFALFSLASGTNREMWNVQLRWMLGSVSENPGGHRLGTCTTYSKLFFQLLFFYSSNQLFSDVSSRTLQLILIRAFMKIFLK